MDITVPVSEFKVKCLALLEEVAKGGGSLVITKRGKPFVTVEPIRTSLPTRRAIWKDAVEITGDIVHVDTAEDWESAS